MLAAALNPTASGFPPAVAASPLLWGTLLRPGAPRERNSIYSEFALPRPLRDSAGQQPRLPPAADHLASSQLQLQAGGAAAAPGAAAGSTGSRKPWEADLLARLLGIARGVIGADVAANQSLMEV